MPAGRRRKAEIDDSVVCLSKRGVVNDGGKDRVERSTASPSRVNGGSKIAIPLRTSADAYFYGTTVKRTNDSHLDSTRSFRSDYATKIRPSCSQVCRSPSSRGVWGQAQATVLVPNALEGSGQAGESRVFHLDGASRSFLPPGHRTTQRRRFFGLNS